MSSAKNGLPTQRQVVVGGLTMGALGVTAAIVGRDFAKAAVEGTPLPPAPRDGTVDILHGIRIEDPFRPLEDAERIDVQAWVNAQDLHARTYLEGLSSRTSVRKFLDAALNYPRTSIPTRYGSRYFASFGEGLEEQRKLGVQLGLDGSRRVLIDPNQLSSDGSISLSGWKPNRDGSKVAYLLSKAGSDKEVLRVRDVDIRQDHADMLLWCKHTSIAWQSDGTAFFYSRYPGDHDPAEWDRKSQIVCWHRLGEPQSADKVIFRLPASPDIYFGLASSFESGLLQITASTGTSEKNGYYITSLDNPGEITELFPLGIASLSPDLIVGRTHYAMTNLDAPKWRLVRIDQSNPSPDQWHTVVPESDLVLTSVSVFYRCLVVTHSEHTGAKVSLRDLKGRIISNVEIEHPADVGFAGSEPEDDHLLMGVEDYKRSMRIERIELATGITTLFRAPAAKHDLSDTVMRQVFVTGKDGVKIPLVLVHRRDIVLDGSNRTWLYGYGGFGESMTPEYSSTVGAWVRMGGIYAVASIRGGGEYGQAWHDGGRLANKQNSFDDFAACAEWLIANHYTRPQRLGISGGSNGGLLTLACMLQRPDLFGAIVSEVPVADMLRFHRFTFGSNWIVEYGDPGEADDFKTLLAYSPLHNVKNGVKYPALLIVTADHDDRVAPAHACKFAATMQDKAPDSEVYLFVKRGSGHSEHLLSKSLDDSANTIAFFNDKLGGPVFELPKVSV